MRNAFPRCVRGIKKSLGYTTRRPRARPRRARGNAAGTAAAAAARGLQLLCHGPPGSAARECGGSSRVAAAAAAALAGSRQPDPLERHRSPAPLLQHVLCRADTHVPEPPYRTYGLRVTASCVLYAPEAQGSLLPACSQVATHLTWARRTYRVPWHHRCWVYGVLTVALAVSLSLSLSRCWVYGVLTVATSPLTRPSGVAALLRMLRLPLGASLRDPNDNPNPNPNSVPRCETQP